MLKLKLSLLCVLTVFLGNGQEGQEWTSGLESNIESLMSSYKAVGLSVAVVKDNKIIYAQGFGLRNLEEELPVTPNTVFPIGSITKSFTGAVLGGLENKKLLSLKDKPSEHIPGFKFYNNEMDASIAIEDLLSHKSGIGDQGTSQVFFPDSSISRTVKRLRYLEPQDEVKNSFAYSNMAYTLAGGIIEQVTGESWDKNIHTAIFQPLHMSNSSTTYEKMKETKNYALGYGLYQGRIVDVPYEPMYSIKPAGAIKSTAIDMGNWMMAWLNNGVFEGNQVLPQSYVQKAMTLQNISEGGYEKDAFLFGDGFGWRLRSSYGHFRVEHGGNNFGFSAELMMFPFDKIGIVVLTNQNLSLLPFMVADAIVQRMFELDREIEYPVKVDEVYRPALDNKGLNTAKLPSHPLKDYQGTYYAKGYGEIEIIKKEEELFAQLPTYRFKLEHLNFNSFYFKGTSDFKEPYSPEFTVKFEVDTEGSVFALKMYSQKKPIDFIKK